MDNEIGGEGTVGSLITQTVNEMLNGKYNQKTLCTILTAILLIMSVNVVGASGTDPLDPSDGGADWDGDGLTNAEEQNEGTDFNNPDSDGDGLPDGWEVWNGLEPE